MKKILFFLLISVSVNAQISTKCAVCPPSLKGVPNGYVLTDSSGHARWQSVSGFDTTAIGVDSLNKLYWSLTGNTGTTAGTNFIGTTDSVDFLIKSKSVLRQRFYANGNTEIPFDPSINYFGFGTSINNPLGRFFSFGNSAGDGLRRATFLNVDDFTATSRSFIAPTLIYSLIASTHDEKISAVIEDVGNNIDYGLYVFDNAGAKTANIYYGVNDGAGHTTDISRIEANKDKVHGRHVIDNTGVAPNYNGWEASDTYTQLEYNKTAEYGQATGNTFVLDNTGFSFFLNGTKKVSVDTGGYLKIVNNAGLNKVLVSDASGKGNWQTLALTDTATLDFGTILANGHQTLTITATGAALSDVVSLGIPNVSMNDHASYVAWVSSANTVSVKCFNFDGSSFDPAAGLFTVKVFK